MSSQHAKPPGSASGILIPLAWLLFAVATPAALIWFSEAGHEQETPGSLYDAVREDRFVRSVEALAELRAMEEQWLETHGWVNREEGIARVPIEMGMKMILSDPPPARDEKNP